jgi:hypothetical protein
MSEMIGSSIDVHWDNAQRNKSCFVRVGVELKWIGDQESLMFQYDIKNVQSIMNEQIRTQYLQNSVRVVRLVVYYRLH